MYAINAGTRLFYTTCGHSGPWVVFSHSLACDHTMWEPQIERLAERFRVLAFDTRGHGASDVSAEGFSLETLADDACAVMDAAGIDRAHFVGLSMGGMIGQYLGLRAPGRLHSLVLANTSSRRPPGAQAVWAARIEQARREGMDALVEGTVSRWFTPAFAAAHPGTAARVGQLIRRTPASGYAGCAAAIAALDITDRLGAVQCPTLLIAGAEDGSTPVSMHEDIQRAIAGAGLVVIQAAAHLSNLEQPDRFSEALETFFSRT